MRILHLLVTGATLSLLSLHAGPMPPLESSSESPSMSMEESPPLNLVSEDDRIPSGSMIEEELSLLDEEMDMFENEILALEEELKRDAELISEPEQKVAILEEPSQAIFSESPALAFEEEAIPNDVEQPKEVVLVPLNREAKEEHIQPVAQEPLQPIQDAIPQIEERAISSAETSARIIPATERLSAVPFSEMQEPVATLDIETSNAEKKNEPVQIDIQHAFAGSPIIYTILLGMSIFAFTVWLYSLLSLRKTGRVSLSFVQEVKNKLNSNNFDGALSLCTQQENLVNKMVATGINARRHGLSVMIENMKIEGKRASIHFWQRIGLLNDIAVIAPMIGLLGTVLGMFYAFYDINRSIESISTLFDGLGISVGTTVAGLAVAILALILHSLAKYQLVKVLTIVENEAQMLATIIDDRSAEYQKR